MDKSEWTGNFAREMAKSIKGLQSTEEIQILDIGIFPWHGLIELSALYSSDLQKGGVYVDDIAGWPHYNFSANENSQWPEIGTMAEAMKTDYANDRKQGEEYFLAAAEAVKSPVVQSAIEKLKRSKDFRVNLIHPDIPDKKYL